MRTTANEQASHASSESSERAVPARRAAGAWSGRLAERLRRALRANWAALLVVGTYLATAGFVVPVASPVAISDDWVYSRSVEILLTEGRLEILGAAAANAIVQVFWAAPFALVWPEIFGALRIATVVFTALSAFALHALCRDLDIPRALAVLATAAFLFNPLSYVLSFTYLSDPYYLGLMLMATWLAVRAVRGPTLSNRALLLSSLFAALAYLQRQQGLFLPLSIGLFLLLSRRLRPDMAGLGTVLRVVMVPGLAVVGHAVWSARQTTERFAQDDFLAAVLGTTVTQGLTIVGRMAFLEAAYLGFLAAPLAAVALWHLPALGRRVGPIGWWLLLGWQVVLLGGLAGWAGGGGMPYLGPYVNREGVGPSEIAGFRPPAIPAEPLRWFTVVCVVASLLIALAIVGGFLDREVRRGRPGMLLVIGGVQAGACILPSFLFVALDLSISLDRYLVPILPFGLVAGAWALRGVRPRAASLTVGVAVVAVFAAYSVVGTRDYLLFQRAVWDLAAEAVQLGIPLAELDAGVQPRPVGPEPFWTAVISPLVDTRYVISQFPLEDFQTVLLEREYPTIMDRARTSIFLLQRNDVDGELLGG
jgi:hypothetical protein